MRKKRFSKAVISNFWAFLRCPENTSMQIPCEPGFYQPNAQSAECIICPAGYYCPDSKMTEPKECENNNYCEEGVAQPTPCPDGTITSNDTLLISGMIKDILIQ